MAASKISPRIPVLIWAALTTTFFWTSTMRMLFKPEISSWGIFNLGGKGLLGDSWLPPTIILFALFLFYLEGRGRLRTLYHILIIGWNALLTAVIIYGSTQTESQIYFDAWGVTVSFIWLIVPFILFLLLTMVLALQERRGKDMIPVYDWTKINRKPFFIALLLFPVAILFFQMGTGFNWQVKIAVGATIVQWILLTEAAGRPYTSKPGI